MGGGLTKVQIITRNW